MERYSTEAVGLSKDKHLQPCALTCTQGGGRMWLTRLPRMEAASVITSLQVSQKSFSADSSCACMRKAAAFATRTGGNGGTCMHVTASDDTGQQLTSQICLYLCCLHAQA